MGHPVPRYLANGSSDCFTDRSEELMSFIKSVSRVTFEQDRLEEATYWASKSIAERVKAGWDLAEDNLFQRKQEHEPERRTTITFRSVERGRR